MKIFQYFAILILVVVAAKTNFAGAANEVTEVVKENKLVPVEETGASEEAAAVSLKDVDAGKQIVNTEELKRDTRQFRTFGFGRPFYGGGFYRPRPFYGGGFYRPRPFYGGFYRPRPFYGGFYRPRPYYGFYG